MAHANISRFWMLKGDKAGAEEWQAKARVLGWKDEIKRKGDAAPTAGLERPPDAELVTRQEEAVTSSPKDVRAPRSRGQLPQAVRRLRRGAAWHWLAADAQMSAFTPEAARRSRSRRAGDGGDLPARHPAGRRARRPRHATRCRRVSLR
jgi:hypothetical protein